MAADRPQLRASDFGLVPGLQRPLNDALLALCLRLEALEGARGVMVLPSIEFKTPGAVAPNAAPFPIQIATPKNFTPVGLLVLYVERLDSTPPTSVSKTATTVVWRATQSEGLEVLYLTGLANSARYRVTLGAIRG